MGIEPTPRVWKTPILPLYDTRIWLQRPDLNRHMLGYESSTLPDKLLCNNGDLYGIRTRECMRERHMS